MLAKSLATEFFLIEIQLIHTDYDRYRLKLASLSILVFNSVEKRIVTVFRIAYHSLTSESHGVFQLFLRAVQHT